MKKQTFEAGLLSLYEMDWGYRAARVLHVANKFDIFTILSEQAMTAEQICQKIKGEPIITEKLLIACAAMGLLESKDGQYKNTWLTQKYLVRGGDLYQGDMIAHSASVWNFWSTLGEQVTAGVSDRVNISDEGHRDFILAMHDIAVGGRAQFFLDCVDLTGRKKLFDVGGGPGTYSICACERYPELEAVVFDLSETIAIAREIIAKAGMQGRVSVRQGDWDVDDFGSGNDVVLLSDVLHGPTSNAEMKLRKAYDSLVDGGLLVIQEFLLNDDKSGPLTAALFNVMVGAFSKSELLSIIEVNGFSQAKLVGNNEQIGAGWVTAIKQ